MYRLTPVVKNLIILNVIFFLASYIVFRTSSPIEYTYQGTHYSVVSEGAHMLVVPDNEKSEGMAQESIPVLQKYLSLFYPESSLFHPYQFITYMFMHGGFMHILFNMLALWMFGSEVESYWGPRKFLMFYIICGLGAALLHFTITYAQIHIFGHNAHEFLSSPMLGASGAIYGILLAFGMMFPDRQLIMLFFPVPIRAKYMVLLWAGIELFSGIHNSAGDNVAHFAHLGGMLTGFIIILIWKAQGKFYS